MMRDVPEYSTGNVKRGVSFLLWADVDHMVTILSADQQVANVAAVAFITHIHIPAGPKQIQSMTGLLNIPI